MYCHAHWEISISSSSPTDVDRSSSYDFEAGLPLELCHSPFPSIDLCFPHRPPYFGQTEPNATFHYVQWDPGTGGRNSYNMGEAAREDLSDLDWPCHDMSSNVTMVNWKTFHMVDHTRQIQGLLEVLCVGVNPEEVGFCVHDMSWHVMTNHEMTRSDSERVHHAQKSKNLLYRVSLILD